MHTADLSLAAARALDANDPLGRFREKFLLPPGLIYLDGNSLGALPRAVIDRIGGVIQQEWGCGLVRSWNSCDWINSATNLGKKVARIIGAQPDEVVVTDSTSVNLARLVLTALQLQPRRTQVLSETGSFPTDLYACEGATGIFGRGRSLRLMPRSRLLDAISDSTALVMLTHIHYKTSEVHDMAEITRVAQSRGALVLWDLSHSAGAVPVDLNGAGADFAVGCGYKYLNGGPGAPAFLYVSRKHLPRAQNAICGWLGHARPFDFTDEYVAASGIRRFLAGTPSILANCALEVGIDLVLEAGIERISAKSQRLSDFFLTLAAAWCEDYGLKCVSPLRAEQRGSHLSYTHPHGYEIMQALISESVIGDFRAPDIIRFGFTPLYTRFEDAWIAAQKLRGVLEEELWRAPRFAVRAAVT
ncbi:MAG: kynureninase [Steroidobacteraceae bacterium]